MLKCELYQNRALPVWLTREGLVYSRHSLTLEAVLEWLVRKAVQPHGENWLSWAL